MGKRWHKPTKQFLDDTDPLILDIDRRAEEARQQERNRIGRLLQQTADNQRQREIEMAEWEEKHDRIHPLNRKR